MSYLRWSSHCSDKGAILRPTLVGWRIGRWSGSHSDVISAWPTFPGRTAERWFPERRPYGSSGRAMVEGTGFEPVYAKRSDLQSDGFNHSPTPPLQRRSGRKRSVWRVVGAVYGGLMTECQHPSAKLSKKTRFHQTIVGSEGKLTNSGPPGRQHRQAGHLRSGGPTVSSSQGRCFRQKECERPAHRPPTGNRR